MMKIEIRIAIFKVFRMVEGSNKNDGVESERARERIEKNKAWADWNDRKCERKTQELQENDALECPIWYLSGLTGTIIRHGQGHNLVNPWLSRNRLNVTESFRMSWGPGPSYQVHVSGQRGERQKEISFVKMRERDECVSARVRCPWARVRAAKVIGGGRDGERDCG